MKKLIFFMLLIYSTSYSQYWDKYGDDDIVNTNFSGNVVINGGLFSSTLYPTLGMIIYPNNNGVLTNYTPTNLYNNLTVTGNIYHTGTFYYNNVPLTSSQWGAGVNGQTIYYPYNVGIGSNNTGNFKLAVDGNIGTRGLKITLQNPWPDFVFSEKYSLMQLPELKKYIEENNKLPDIPSEQEVEDNGLDVEEMTAKLLQKVEELTLHVIRLDEENTKLKAEVEILKNAK
ncbi:MAG: hypothetical protein JSS63_04780 [Bacteroidetes bacterium]|nr:hypothetical protein [Bacteroidota bacterium]